MSVIRVSLLIVGFLFLVVHRGSASYSCSGEQNMMMVPDYDDRHAYYLCINGRAEKFYCPPGLKFDPKKPACVPKRVNTWN